MSWIAIHSNDAEDRVRLVGDLVEKFFTYARSGDSEFVAERRILRPISQAARQQIDDAFRQTQQIQKEVTNVLLMSDSDPAAFRKVYPSSPALGETLVECLPCSSANGRH